MATCNHCTLERVRRQAKAEGKAVHLAHGRMLGGTDVFVTPPDVSRQAVLSWQGPSDEFPNGDENHEKYFACWLMQIPDHCVA